MFIEHKATNHSCQMRQHCAPTSSNEKGVGGLQLLEGAPHSLLVMLVSPPHHHVTIIPAPGQHNDRKRRTHQ